MRTAGRKLPAVLLYVFTGPAGGQIAGGVLEVVFQGGVVYH